MLEPTYDDIELNIGFGMSNVGVVIGGLTTHKHFDLLSVHRLKCLLSSYQCIKNFQSHRLIPVFIVLRSLKAFNAT